jgi:esterase/lipase superfamily enzyme
LSGVAAQLAAIDVDERDALIFVHGYNVSFQEAALRAAQIGFDLSVKGAMAFFSWPSQGATAHYSADEATIEASERGCNRRFHDRLRGEERRGCRAHHCAQHGQSRGIARR